MEVPLVVSYTRSACIGNRLLGNSAYLWVLESVDLTILVEGHHWVHFFVNVQWVPARITPITVADTLKTSHVNCESEDSSSVCAFEAGDLSLNLNGLAWVLSKLDEASPCDGRLQAANSWTCSIDGLVEVGRDVGFHRRAILLICTPPSSSVHSIAS